MSRHGRRCGDWPGDCHEKVVTSHRRIDNPAFASRIHLNAPMARVDNMDHFDMKLTIGMTFNHP
jgi:hypothetical protein